jgi:chorismate synthase
MRGNTFGKVFRLTTFGESHGPAIGGIIDGCPAGLHIDADQVQSELDRRKPGQSKIVSQRKESDKVNFLSGIFEGRSTGMPIGFQIPNEDQRSHDYTDNSNKYRPSHADLTYDVKYGFRDHRGGGRSSARETASWVVGGAIAKMILAKENVSITAFTCQVGDIQLLKNYTELDLSTIDDNVVRCPDALIAETMISRIEQVRKDGDTIGGVITCVVSGLPQGLGEPVFDKLHADLGKAMLTINAVKGFEIGTGFAAAKMKGSEHNDLFEKKEERIGTRTNNSGGIQGGISNGEDIVMRIAFKPVATLIRSQPSVTTEGEETEFHGKGRHDPCVVPRAVPVVEAMAAMVLADHMLRQRSVKI